MSPNILSAGFAPASPAPSKGDEGDLPRAAREWSDELGERVRTVNLEHVRPIVAFCCVAAAAAVVTGLGLGAETPQVQVRAGVPTAVQTTDAVPALVLGSSLTARPTASATVALPGSFSFQDYATMFATLSGLLDEAAVRTAPTVAGPKAPVPTDNKDVATARATPTSSPTAPAGDDGGEAFPGRGDGTGHASDNASENAGGKGQGAGQGAQGKAKG